MKPLRHSVLAVFAILTWIAAGWAWLRYFGDAFFIYFTAGLGIVCLTAMIRLFHLAKDNANTAERGSAVAAGLIGYLLLGVIAALVFVGVTAGFQLTDLISTLIQGE